MQAVIHFLTDIAVAGIFVVAFILFHKWDEYRRFKRKFRKGQYIHFYVGHKQNFGTIIKISFTKAQVRSALDTKIYTKPFYQIQKPYKP